MRLHHVGSYYWGHGLDLKWEWGCNNLLILNYGRGDRKGGTKQLGLLLYVEARLVVGLSGGGGDWF